MQIHVRSVCCHGSEQIGQGDRWTAGLEYWYITYKGQSDRIIITRKWRALPNVSHAEFGVRDSHGDTCLDFCNWQAHAPDRDVLRQLTLGRIDHLERKRVIRVCSQGLVYVKLQFFVGVAPGSMAIVVRPIARYRDSGHVGTVHSSIACGIKPGSIGAIDGKDARHDLICANSELGEVRILFCVPRHITNPRVIIIIHVGVCVAVIYRHRRKKVGVFTRQGNEFVITHDS